MITKEQTLTAREFHENTDSKVVGPRGGITIRVSRWFRNGKIRTWKRSPLRFSIPIKHGLRSYAYITENTAHFYHTPDDPSCPLNKGE